MRLPYPVLLLLIITHPCVAGDPYALGGHHGYGEAHPYHDPYTSGKGVPAKGDGYGYHGHEVFRHCGAYEDQCDACPPTGLIPHVADHYAPVPLPLKKPGPAKWILRGEVISFERGNEDPQPFIFREVDDAELFTFADFPWEERVGYRGVAQVNLGPRYSVEAIYMRLHDEFSQVQEVDDGIMPDVEPIELRVAGIILNTPTETFDVRYSTRFQSAELNAKYYVDHWTTAIFGGFRWVEIDERFSAGITNLPPPLTVNTSNKMYGMQMGIESQHWIGYGVVRMESSLRGGILRNTAEQLTTLDAASAFARNRDLAWVGESEIALSVPVNQFGLFRVSYRLIHIAGLALAADQINVTDLTIPAAGISDEGQAIYHGLAIGFEAWR